MKKMMNRINKKEGFTLAELLIVVAIIAVLVAVSIPVFTSRLEKARESTDLANLRAAYAAGVAGYLGDEANYAGKTVYYNAGQGKLVSTVAEADSCLKGTTADGGTASTAIGGSNYSSGTSVANKKIKVAITASGGVTVDAE